MPLKEVRLTRTLGELRVVYSVPGCNIIQCFGVSVQCLSFHEMSALLSKSPVHNMVV